MEHQFNYHHSAVKHIFAPGSQVLVKDYWNDTNKRIQGHIGHCNGNVTSKPSGFDMQTNFDQYNYKTR